MKSISVPENLTKWSSVEKLTAHYRDELAAFVVNGVSRAAMEDAAVQMAVGSYYIAAMSVEAQTGNISQEEGRLPMYQALKNAGLIRSYGNGKGSWLVGSNKSNNDSIEPENKVSASTITKPTVSASPCEPYSYFGETANYERTPEQEARINACKKVSYEIDSFVSDYWKSVAENKYNDSSIDSLDAEYTAKINRTIYERVIKKHQWSEHYQDYEQA